MPGRLRTLLKHFSAVNPSIPLFVPVMKNGSFPHIFNSVGKTEPEFEHISLNSAVVNFVVFHSMAPMYRNHFPVHRARIAVMTSRICGETIKTVAAAWIPVPVVPNLITKLGK